MKVIYKKTSLERISEATADAARKFKTIDRIELSVPEFNTLKREGTLPGGLCSPAKVGEFMNVFGVYCVCVDSTSVATGLYSQGY